MLCKEGNVQSRNNAKRWTGKMRINSKTVMTYIKETDKQDTRFRSDLQERVRGMNVPIIVSFQFVRVTRHRFDYINPAQTVQDLMVKNDWIEDDNMEFIIPHFEPYEYDKENPGVEIRVYERTDRV